MEANKITLKVWNGSYYCQAVMPDESKAELSSVEDLNFTQWQKKIEETWIASQTPPPEEKPTLAAFSDVEIKGEFVRRGLKIAVEVKP